MSPTARPQLLEKLRKRYDLVRDPDNPQVAFKDNNRCLIAKAV